jgi:hypothetical protein
VASGVIWIAQERCEEFVAAWEDSESEVGKSSMTEASSHGNLAFSFFLAALAGLCSPAIVFPLTKNNELTTNMFLLSGFIIGPGWAIMAFRLMRYNWKRGLWVLIGLPFAMSCTGMILWFPFGCGIWGDCL